MRRVLVYDDDGFARLRDNISLVQLRPCSTKRPIEAFFRDRLNTALMSALGLANASNGACMASARPCEMFGAELP